MNLRIFFSKIFNLTPSPCPSLQLYTQKSTMKHNYKCFSLDLVESFTWEVIDRFPFQSHIILIQIFVYIREMYFKIVEKWGTKIRGIVKYLHEKDGTILFHSSSSCVKRVGLPLLLKVYRTFQNGHERKDTNKSLNWGGMSKG